MKRLSVGIGVVAVLAVVAWLFWPGGGPEPTAAQASSARFGVRLSVTEPRTGLNTIDLEITDPHGHPAAPAEVTVEPVMPQMGHALEASIATAERPGHYRVTEALLPMAGQWEITVRLRDGEGTEELTFPLLVTN